jgi:hypothetical protein
MTHRAMIDITKERRDLGSLAPVLYRGAGIVGIASLAVSVVIAVGSGERMERLLSSYLTSFAFFLSLSLGALFFTILHHLVRAGWSVVVRRVAETLAGNVLLMAVLAIPIVIGAGHIYHWAGTGAAVNDHLLQHKRPWLNVPFFAIRIAVYFAVWVFVSRFFITRSLRQDRSGDVALSIQMERFSAPAMVLFGITMNFAAFDLLMSLDPHWYSTIFGVYFFSGGVVGFFALLPLLTILIQRSGRLTNAVTPEHYHDMGKLIFAFVIFWAYIGFSQYMLIWYANLPEETVWYLRRQSGSWRNLSLLLLFGHFILPFILLIGRRIKRQRALLAGPALWVLVMHWVDIYWIVMPQATPGGVRFHILDLTCLLGIGGLFVAFAVHRLRHHPLVPEKDPRLAESLQFESA